MTNRGGSIRRFLRWIVPGLHVLFLMVVVVVPCYAVGEAVSELLRYSSLGRLANTVHFARWPALLGNTVAVCGVALTTALLPGLALGLLTGRTDLPGRKLIIGATILGACIPVYATAIFIFSAIPVSKFANSTFACGLCYGLVYAPLAILVLGAAFRSVDRQLEDQALLDAGMGTVFWRVTLPQVVWAIVTLSMVVCLLVATDFTFTDILMVRTFAEEVYTQYALHGSQAGPLITSFPVFVAMAATLVAVQMRFRLLGEHSPWAHGERPRDLNLGRFRTACAMGCVLIVLGALGTPAYFILRRIGSFAGFASAIESVYRELMVSAILGSVAATAIVISATGLAWFALRGGRLRGPVCGALVALLALPSPVVGISLIGLLNRPGWPGWLYDSPLIIVVGYIVRFLPIAVLILIPAVQRVPIELEQAARIDGCGWLGTQWHIHWPTISLDAGIVWLVIVVLCFGELGCTALLAPPGWSTASVRAFTLMHFGVYRDLAGLAIASAACVSVPWLALTYALKRKFRDDSAPTQAIIRRSQ